MITGLRTTLGTLGIAAVTAIGLYYTRQTLEHNRVKDREEAGLPREGQLTERYVEAIKLLSAEKDPIQRLGGIYALERIMWDSRRDHQTVVEVLASLIRQASATGTPEGASEPRPGQDVQAALDVLGRMPVREGKPVRIDLGRTRLHGVNLYEARLEGKKVNLEGASCTVESLLTARITSSTRLPKDVADDPRIQEHISECESRAGTLEPEAFADDCGWEPSGRSFPHEVILRSIH